MVCARTSTASPSPRTVSVSDPHCGAVRHGAPSPPVPAMYAVAIGSPQGSVPFEPTVFGGAGASDGAGATGAESTRGGSTSFTLAGSIHSPVAGSIPPPDVVASTGAGSVHSAWVGSAEPEVLLRASLLVESGTASVAAGSTHCSVGAGAIASSWLGAAASTTVGSVGVGSTGAPVEGSCTA